MALKRITDLALAGTITGNELLEISQLSTTVTRTATTLSALASDNSYNDSANGFITAGFAVGNRVKVSGFTGNVANNIAVGVITALTAGKMTIGGTDGDVIVDDAAGESVTIAKWTSRRVQVDGLPNGAGAAVVIYDKTASYTLVIGDASSYIRIAVATANTLTVPPNSSVAFPIGSQVTVRQSGAGKTTFVAGSGVTINSAETLNLRKQGSTATLVKVATDTWDLTGDLELL